MALFSTAGADAVHLSAGAEDGNGVKCQVERCPGSVSRWAHLNVLHAPAGCAIKVWSIASLQHCRCSGWPTLFLAGAACRDTLTIFICVCACVCAAGRPASATSDSEDENPEALQPLRPPRPLGNYGLCEQGEPASLHLTTPPPSPREAERSAVVINQPAPLTSPRQPSADTAAHSSDSVRIPIWASRQDNGAVRQQVIVETVV